MRHVETGETIQSLPDDLPEGIRVEIDSANVPLEDLVDVVQALAEFLGIDPGYFAREHLHEWSTCYNLALYVRLQKSIAEEQITSLEGLLDRLSRFQREREGRGELKWNHDEETGYRDAVALDPTALGHFYEDHSVGKLLKCYLMREPDKQAGHVTEHPKLEVQFSSEYSDGAVPWSEVQDLRGELDRYLMHGLKWADLPVEADESVYVADEYWTVEARASDAEPEPEFVPDPTDELVEAEREAATRALLDADASPGERAVIETLVTDGGGAMAYDELADASETSTSTVYRAVERFADVLNLIQGRVQTADRVVQDRLKELVKGLNDTLDWVANGLRHLEDEAGVGVSEDGPLAQWARRYGVEIVEASSRPSQPDLELRLEAGSFTYDELARILRNGYQAARKESERLAMQLRNANAAYDDRDRDRRRTVRAFRWQGGQLRAAGQVPVG